jgi:hypothetical protein
MLLIWYNPDLKQYQKGDKDFFNTQKKQSVQSESFSVLYEFNATSSKLCDHILGVLLEKRKELSPVIIKP